MDGKDDESAYVKSCGSTEFEEALSLTGYGRFHYQIVFVSALCIISAGFQNGVLSYIFPPAKCELNLNSEEMGLLNVAFLAGGACSSFFWGILADTRGRKRVLIISLILDMLTTVISAVTITGFLSFAVSRFLNGFIVGALGSISFTYIAEFHPPKSSSKSVCYAGIFFTSAWLLLPVISYLVLPLNISYRFKNVLVLNSWRLCLITLALPELTALLLILRLPESPKYYIAQGNPKLALQILTNIFVLNSGKPEAEYPVKQLVCQQTVNSVQPPESSSEKAKHKEDMFEQMKELWNQPYRSLIALVSVIMFANMFGFLGLGLWLNELFSRFEDFSQYHPEATPTFQKLAHFTVSPNNSRCALDFDKNMFENTLTLGACTLVGNIISGMLTGHLTIKTIPFVTMLFGAASAVSIYWIQSPLQNLVISCIFFTSMATGNMALNSVATELFPTSISGMAICITLCAGRIGAITSNFMFGYFIDGLCEIPVFVVAALLMAGCILCCALPNDITSDITKERKINKVDIFTSGSWKYKYNEDKVVS